MEDLTATVKQLSALSHETRLSVFRLLMENEGEGVAAGRISEALSVQPNRLTGHLNILVHSGLADVRKQGRHMFYSANVETTAELVRRLIENWCNNNPVVRSASN